MKLTDSFRAAGHGIAAAVRSERNLRIHLCVTAYVLFFAWFAEVTDRLPLLLVCIGLVLALELVNTAIERLADAVCPRFDPKIGAAKDIAAGATLLSAIAAALAGLWIFCAPATLLLVWDKLCAAPWFFAVILLPLPFLYVFCRFPRR